MIKKILINIEPQEKRVAIIKDNILEEFYIERPASRTIVGNIYKGKVEAVTPSINAAFVNIGQPKNGFLYLSEALETIEPVEAHGVSQPVQVKKGDEILVQVVKESFGTKGPRLTTHISMPGRYIVLMPQDNMRGVSHRIENVAERERLLGILREISLPKDLGFIVRTASQERTKKDLIHDSRFLLKLWQRISKVSGRNPAPTLIYEDYDLILRTVRDSFTEDIAELVVDSKPEFYRIRQFVRSFLPHLGRRIRYHRQDLPLFEKEEVEKHINKIYENRVYLKCGGYIIIEPTEGLVVIDVNSGRFRKRTNQEEMAFLVNSQAAVETARQLRLRDLGGIIVIDFIDMQSESHRRQLLSLLKSHLSQDRTKTDCLGISRLGLVEMTRERTHLTVESLSYQDCPYCKGKGKVKSYETLAINVLKQLKDILSHDKRREITALLNPEVARYIKASSQDSINRLSRTYRSNIHIQEDPSLHVEQIKVI